MYLVLGFVFRAKDPTSKSLGFRARYNSPVSLFAIIHGEYMSEQQK